MLSLTWGAGTDTGHRRQRNEDAYLATPKLFAVADGMGGHQRGDVAAALAIEALQHLTDPNLDLAGHGAGPGGFEPPHLSRTSLLDAVRHADQVISTQSTDDPDRAMGTTLCGIGVLSDPGPNTLLAFNVGDSRVYRLRDHQLTQVSRDHSVVQELIDRGELEANMAESHPERNIITRSLGAGGHLEIDWWAIEACQGDRFMLCSDGLVKEVPEPTIEALLSTDRDPQAASVQLIQAALDGGGRDNVTVVVVDVIATSPSGDSIDLDVETNPRHSRTAAPTRPRLAPSISASEEEAASAFSDPTVERDTGDESTPAAPDLIMVGDVPLALAPTSIDGSTR